jgi:hypothetical protein
VSHIRCIRCKDGITPENYCDVVWRKKLLQIDEEDYNADICKMCFNNATDVEELLALGAKHKAGCLRRRQKAIEDAERYRDVLEELNHLTLTEIAAEMDRRGIKPAGGGKWYAASIRRVQGLLGMQTSRVGARIRKAA